MIVVAIIGILASIAISSFLRARKIAQADICINNLRQIEAAKDQYAAETGLSNGALVSFAEIGPSSNAVGGYLKLWPLCPASTTMLLKATPSQQLSESDYSINCLSFSGWPA